MTDLRRVPIGDERFEGDESLAVRSPYDGAELARVPRCGPAEVDRAVAAAGAAYRGLGIAACVQSAESSAGEVMTHLSHHRRPARDT